MIKKLGRKKTAPLLTSSRSRFFKSKSSRLSFRPKRAQKIRVRHRYVASAIKDAGLRFWVMLKAGIIVGGLAWISIFLVHFWNTSSVLKVREIKFYGDIPEKLPAKFSFRPGQNIILMNTTGEEKNILIQFPELKDVSVWRTPLRDIIVRADFRKPEALCQKDGVSFGIDETGFIFPLTKENEIREELPLLVGIRKGDLQNIVNALLTLKKSAPEFYSLIIRLETDTINDINVELKDGISVFWGQMNWKDLIIKAQHVQEVLNHYVPKKKPALLRFITENRLIIDANWAEKNDEKI